jgi:hypothetical protein
MFSTSIHWKLLAPLHVLVLFRCMSLYMLCFLLALFWVIKYVLVGCTSCTGVLIEPFAYCLYFVGSCERLMDHPILGEWYALAFHSPKNMCTWGIPLSVYILNYLVSMWYVMLMRNSNSIMSINYLMLDFICLLWE